MWQLLDKIHRVGITRGFLDVGTRCSGKIAVGNVIGHGVAEQGHMLGYLGDMLAQVKQAVIFYLDAIEQDLARRVVIETRDQVRQCRLATPGTPHQCHHLSRFGREGYILEHLPVGVRVGEAQVAHIQAASDVVALNSAGVDFRFLIQLFKDAFGTRHTLLDRRADFRQLANRLGQQAGQGDVGDHVARRRVATQVKHQEHQDAHRHIDDQLQHRGIDSPRAGHAQLLVGVALAGLQEALALISLTAKAAHNAVALDGFRGNVGNVAHRHLNLLALLAEFLAGRTHHDRNQRQDRDHHQRQAPVHPQQRAEQEHYRHAFTDNHLDRIGSSTGHHGHVEGNTGDQMPRVVLVEVTVGQYQQVVEQLHPQVVHQAQGHLGQEVVAQEGAQALPCSNQYNQDRYNLQQAQITQIGNGRKQHCVRVGQAIDEILEDVTKHWLGRSENKKPDDTQQEQADIRPDIAEQAQIYLQARFACAGAGFGHITRRLVKKDADFITASLVY